MEKVNNYPVKASHVCISAYKPICELILLNDESKWLKCPRCGLKPRVWLFNNGETTACGCGNNEYDHFSVKVESIMSHITRNNGCALHYDSYAIRSAWNLYCLCGVVKRLPENQW